MKKSEDKLTKLLATAKGNSTDIYFTAYEEYIKNSEKPWHELKTVIEYAYDIGTDDTHSKRINDEKINDIVKRHGQFLSVLVHHFIVENLEIEDFYKKIYNMVFVSDAFPQEDEVHVVLLQVLARNIPG